jgi:very-short-patch-repair endonuclease
LGKRFTEADLLARNLKVRSSISLHLKLDAIQGHGNGAFQHLTLRDQDRHPIAPVRAIPQPTSTPPKRQAKPSPSHPIYGGFTVRERSPRRSRSGSTPHDILWNLVVTRWPFAIRELKDVVPGRRYRIDIGFQAQRLAIEVDGFSHHGKFQSDFQRDRDRQNLLTVHQWRILRFSAGDIRKRSHQVMQTIEQALLGVAPPPASKPAVAPAIVKNRVPDPFNAR